MFKKRGTFEKVLMIFIFFFFDILLTGLMGTVKAEPISIGYIINNGIRILVAIAIMYVMTVEYGHELKTDNQRNFQFNWRFSKRNLLIMVSGIVIMLGFQVLISLALSGNQTSTNEASLNEILSKVNFLFPLFVMFVGPVVEEYLFRGLFFNLFFKKETRLNNVVGIIVNGLLFGLMHETSISIYLLLYSVMGMILASVYLFTKDIKSSIVVHIVNNVISSL
ncbi:CPBP family intramembrane glutamic endopeptidase [Holzapfeliella sp. He02]|uniref:CPBP family intramembrane glutamic endopeptidase n=1 Tax=Holzapfeliella saturejae TaxID=3082953 RepID=A0ABU8SEN1_9LACO